jgi:chloramphenicol-sensitive protein RarD
MGVQLWLFSWAPLHGHALDASLGFVILPLTLVLGSRLALGAEVSKGQWVAVGIALVAVTIKVALTPQVSWVTFVIGGGFPVYFVLRRRFGLDGPMAFGLEVATLTPVAVLLILTGTAPDSGTAALALFVVGVSGAGAMAAYLTAARLLSLPLFGLLGYLEPVGLVVVALILGDRMHSADLIVYVLLALALTVLAAEGYRVSGSPRQASSPELAAARTPTGG